MSIETKKDKLRQEKELLKKEEAVLRKQIEAVKKQISGLQVEQLEIRNRAQQQARLTPEALLASATKTEAGETSGANHSEELNLSILDSMIKGTFQEEEEEDSD